MTLDFIDLFIIPGYITRPVFLPTYVVALLVTRSRRKASDAAAKAIAPLIAAFWIATTATVGIIIYGSLCYAVVDLPLTQFNASEKTVLVTTIPVTLLTLGVLGYVVYLQEKPFREGTEDDATDQPQGRRTE